MWMDDTVQVHTSRQTSALDVVFFFFFKLSSVFFVDFFRRCKKKEVRVNKYSNSLQTSNHAWAFSFFCTVHSKLREGLRVTFSKTGRSVVCCGVSRDRLSCYARIRTQKIIIHKDLSVAARRSFCCSASP